MYTQLYLSKIRQVWLLEYAMGVAKGLRRLVKEEKCRQGDDAAFYYFHFSADKQN